MIWGSSKTNLLAGNGFGLQIALRTQVSRNEFKKGMDPMGHGLIL